MMRVNILAIGGISAFGYSIITLSLYILLCTRWNVINGGDPGQILLMVNKRHGEWSALWWGITIIPYAIIPTFLAVLYALWKEDAELSSMAFMAGVIALVLGIIGPLRSATVTETLADIYANGNEMQKVAAQVAYRSGESYGKGLFCLFGAT